MVSKKEFLIEMKKLEIAFNNFDLTQERLSLFYENLCDYDLNELQFVVNATIKSNKFAPTIADLRNQIENLKTNSEQKAREFESKISLIQSISTDELIKVFEKKGDLIAVEVLKNNYLRLREIGSKELNTFSAQLREQYKAKVEMKKNYEIIKSNKLKIGIENLAEQLKLK